MKPTKTTAAKETLPKAARFLMRNEDKGAQEDGDATDGGQDGGDSSDQGIGDPELHAAMKDLVAKHGAQAVRDCSSKHCDSVLDGDSDNLMADDDGDRRALNTGKANVATPKSTGSGRYTVASRRR